VLIGDSESNDGSIEAALREHPSLRVFTVSRARFDHGLVRTALIKKARAKKVALFSQDAIPLSRQYLQKMAAVLDDESIAGVYARQQPRPGADPLIHEMLERWTPSATDPRAKLPILKELADGVRLEDLEPLERMKKARFDNVASMVQAELFDRMPFPSRDFGEDIAWGALVLSAGLKLAYLPTAAVAHHHAPRLRSTFERNRVAHRQACGEFGLHAVPGLSHLARALISGIPDDLRAGPVWALRGVPRRGAALLGQWAGAREACRESGNES
jgi:rhamnosyltransferase